MFGARTTCASLIRNRYGYSSIQKMRTISVKVTSRVSTTYPWLSFTFTCFWSLSYAFSWKNTRWSFCKLSKVSLRSLPRFRSSCFTSPSRGLPTSCSYSSCSINWDSCCSQDTQSESMAFLSRSSSTSSLAYGRFAGTWLCLPSSWKTFQTTGWIQSMGHRIHFGISFSLSLPPLQQLVMAPQSHPQKAV